MDSFSLLSVSLPLSLGLKNREGSACEAALNRN